MTDESLTKLEKQLTDMKRSITDLAWVMVLLTGIIILSLQDAPMLSTESIFPAFFGASRDEQGVGGTVTSLNTVLSLRLRRHGRLRPFHTVVTEKGT